MQASLQERLLSAFLAALVVALFGYGLFIGMTVDFRSAVERPLMLLDLPLPRTPPPPPPEHHVERPAPKRASAPASPRNLRNKAAAIVAPPPVVLVPLPPPVVSAPKAGLGMAASAGASDRPGPGQGAGGEGNGSGAGGEGDGDGGGGGDAPPRQIRGHLKFADMPADLRDAGVSGTVSVRYAVGVDGRVGYCIVTTSSGNAALDQLTCQLIRQRFRFYPSRDRDGRPVSSAIEENHSWENYNIPDDPVRP